MARVNINRLEKAILQNSIGVTDATLEQRYLLLNPIDFTVNATEVTIKGMGFADEIATIAPAITAIPPSAPSSLGRHTVLRRKYNNLFRTWIYDSVAWVHVYDEPIKNTALIALTAVPAHVAVPTGANTPYGDMFVVPSALNGASIIEGAVIAASGSGSVAVSVYINGFAASCLTFTCTSVYSSVTCPGITLASGDTITMSLTGKTGVLVGTALSLVYTLPE